jgi:hypothetical protein
MRVCDSECVGGSLCESEGLIENVSESECDWEQANVNLSENMFLC